MLIDQATITVRAGSGGKGVVAFNKTKMMLGPTGGSGGKGGDVYCEAVVDIGALRTYRTKKSFHAEDGKDGRSAFRDGRRGNDLVLSVPRGTVVHNDIDRTAHELVAVGDRVLVARGGWGGKGNFLFKSSKNTSPMESRAGYAGEERVLRLELKLIADVGLIGLPNVGKSSFLNAVTNAKSPVANYAFTTLEPHLGAYYGFIIADIPGLIAGASRGKGLGAKFLKHIERTRMLFHFVSAESADPRGDYDTVRTELGAWNVALLQKPEYILVSKADAVPAERLREVRRLLALPGKDIVPVSVVDAAMLADVQKILNNL